MRYSLNRTTCFGQGRPSSGHQEPGYALYNIRFQLCNAIPLLDDQHTLIKMGIIVKPSGLKLGAYCHSLQMWNDCRCSLEL